MTIGEILVRYIINIKSSHILTFTSNLLLLKRKVFVIALTKRKRKSANPFFFFTYVRDLSLHIMPEHFIEPLASWTDPENK